MTADRCKRCGHPLRDPESQTRGYGPVCYQKVNNTPAQQERELRRQRLLTFLGRENAAQFCCEQCGEPTPVPELKRGLCPRCRGEPVRLEEQDIVPFAEVR